MALNHTLGIGVDALFATRQGIDTAGHNIANAHVEGYSRQRVNITPRDPLERYNLLLGNGVYVKNITRAHDSFLEKQINETNQSAGAHQAMTSELKAIESIFSPELNASVSDQMSIFFNQMQQLSNFPEELTVRTSVREAAKDLTSSLRKIDESLGDAQKMIDSKIEGETKEISRMLAQVADLNVRINTEETGGGKPANDLRDQQDKLVRELSQKMEVSYYRGNFGMLTVRGPGGILLVDMNAAAKMDVSKNSETAMNDIVVIDSSGRTTRNVTDKNEGGSLNGLVKVRDEIIVGLRDNNNELARTFADSFNEVHRQGFGLKNFKEATGRDFFTMDDSDKPAATLRVADAIEASTDAISVAATPNAPGDNVIANDLLRLRDAKILQNGNATMTDFYSNFVGNFGLDVVRADQMKQADDIIVADLSSRREAIAGVSLDEEATNLMRWQANFTAASKLITTVDEMMETVLQMKR